jgi:uncharacterized protein YggE
MKKLLILATLIPIISFGQLSNNEKFITVIGIAEMEIEPNLITLSMTSNETESTKKESPSYLRESQIIKFITLLGIKRENFSVKRLYASEQFSLSSSTKFKQTKNYELTIPKASLLDTIVTKCFELGMDNISVYKLDHSKIDSLRNSLLPLALISAKSKAELIARNIGASLGKVINVNESYQLVNNRQDYYNDQAFLLNEVVWTGSTSGARYNSRISNSISFEKIHLSKTIIVKFEIN